MNIGDTVYLQWCHTLADHMPWPAEDYPIGEAFVVQHEADSDGDIHVKPVVNLNRAWDNYGLFIKAAQLATKPPPELKSLDDIEQYLGET